MQGGSKGSLLVTGTVAAGVEFAWAGIMFTPGERPMAPANLSSKKQLSFWARGDGGTYQVLLFSESHGYAPARQVFTAAAEWKEYTFALSAFDGMDGHDLMGVAFVGGPKPGKLRLQLDDVRFQWVDCHRARKANSPPGPRRSLVRPRTYEGGMDLQRPDAVRSRLEAFALWMHLKARGVCFELEADPAEWVTDDGRAALDTREVATFRRLIAEVDRLGAEAFDCYADARRVQELPACLPRTRSSLRLQERPPRAHAVHGARERASLPARP